MNKRPRWTDRERMQSVQEVEGRHERNKIKRDFFFKRYKNDSKNVLNESRFRLGYRRRRFRFKSLKTILTFLMCINQTSGVRFQVTGHGDDDYIGYNV